ncbi:MAG: hypothetical protein JO104_12070 [Candidatus Eremiobacteraeota bacterium]|nr:hypothetical protein [Candidatus Eremiobacteraeota bacterium]
MAIPDVLKGTVLGRFRRLDRGARAVIMRASVIGREFDLHVVVATATHSESHVRGALEHACRLQLVVESGGDRYTFRHALTRDIIYAEFLDERTRPLHRRIARVLERSSHSRDVALEELAYHSWAGGDARRGPYYNELAGDYAAVVHARDDARRYYTRALSLIDVDSAGYGRLTQKLRALGG